jgi:ATP-dependent RNA helicase DOB1
VAGYYDYRKQLDQMGEDFRLVITHPTYCLPFLQAGRLVRVKHKDANFGWGVVINFQKRIKSKVSFFSYQISDELNRAFDVQTKSEFHTDDIPAHEQYIIDVLLNCADGATLPKDRNISTPTPGGIQPCLPGRKGTPLVVPILLSTVEALSHIRIFLPKDLRQDQARETVWKSVLEVERRFPDGITLLDPVENMGIKDEKFLNLIKVRFDGLYLRLVLTVSHIACNQKIDVMEKRMFSNPLHRDPRLPSLYTLYSQKQEAQANIRALKKRISATHDVLQLEELKCRKRVLRRLGFTNSSDIADMKGRVACEISTGDELLLTELIFNGIFNTLLPEQCAGLLSCFVFTEKVRIQVILDWL